MKSLTSFVALLCSSLASMAGVQVDLSHSYVGAASVLQNTGEITLSFSVDGSGSASLAASCTDPDPATYVNEFSAAMQLNTTRIMAL